MFKKILLLVLCSTLLVSCGEESEVTSEGGSQGLNITNFSDFSIGIPDNWEIITSGDKILPEPNQGTIELAVTSSKKTANFYNNLLILSDTLSSFQTSKDFSSNSNLGAETDYVEYKKIESKQFVFNDSEESFIYIFEARYNTSTPKTKFIQVGRICNVNKGFLLTIAIPTSIQKTTQYEALLQTFKCESFSDIETK